MADQRQRNHQQTPDARAALRSQQAMPGVYIVHAAPFLPGPLDVSDVSTAAADYKWGARPSPPGPAPGGMLPSFSPVSSSAGTADGRISTLSATKTYVQDEIGAAARLRNSVADSGLHSGGLGQGQGHGPGGPGLLNGVQPPNNTLAAIKKTLLPMFYVLVIYGVIPVRLSPVRLSIHPLRSTVLWVVAVQIAVTLSVHHVYSSYSGLLHSEPENARGVDERLLAILSIMHVSSHVILPIIWGETRNVRSRRQHLLDFVKQFGHLVGPQPLSRWTRFMPLYSLLFCLVSGPTVLYVWCIYIVKKPILLHGPSHLFQLILVFSALVLFATACMIVRDLAADVAAKLKQELGTSKMTASRLEEFRLAWLSLRQLTVDLGCMPLTGLATLLYLLILVTLTTYQSAVSYYNNYLLLCIGSTGILLLSQVALIHICDCSHRLSDVMTSGFYEPLESKSWRGLPADLLAEYQQFLHTISTTPAEVTFGGMITIKRSTYLSIMAAIATYLIVLFQLRMADEVPVTTTSPPNATDSSLD